MEREEIDGPCSINDLISALTSRPPVSSVALSPSLQFSNKCSLPFLYVSEILKALKLHHPEIKFGFFYFLYCMTQSLCIFICKAGEVILIRLL